MRLWIDGQCLQTASRMRGIGRYVLSLLEAIALRGDVELIVSLNAALLDEAEIAREGLLRFLPASNIRLWHGLSEGPEVATGFIARRAVSEIALRHHVAMLAPDIALAASPFEGMGDGSVPFLPAPDFPVPVAAICYDFIPITYPEHYLQSETALAAYERRLKALAHANHLLAISDYTASETGRFLPGTPVTAISAGLPEPFRRLAAEAGETQPDAHAVLYVGSLDWRKNVDILPRALALLPEPLRSGIELRIAGAYVKPDQQRIQAVHDSLGLDARQLRWLGTPDDAALITHYRQASLVVQPSLLEGFGLTALEAMACGTPVLAANAGSLPEVVGEDGARFDPTQPEDLARALSALLGNAPRLATLAREGQARALGFTWEKVAERAITAIRPLVPAGRRVPAPERLEQAAVNALSPWLSTVEPETVARVMALATPAPMGAGRLLVDVTATVRERDATGIQRVVRKVVTHLHQQGKAVMPTWSTSPALLHPVGLSPEGVLAESPDMGRTLGVRPGDHFLQLDSSWGDIDAQIMALRGARLAGARITFVVYDLIPLRTPAFCAEDMPAVFRHWLLRAMTLADDILCISRTVALDVMRFLEEIRCPQRIRVGFWRLGADFGAKPARLPQPAGQRPRFLMVGTLEPRKAHRVALEAFEQLWARGIDVELVFAGKQGWHVERLVERLRGHPEFNRRLHWHNAPNDAALGALYASARAVIVPSFAEGYGLPISEGLHLGIPVVASDIPVFREVAGEASGVRFFEVGNPGALAEAVVAMIAGGDVEAHEAMTPASWAESAASMADLLAREDWAFTHDPALLPEQPPQSAATAEGIELAARIVDGPDRLSDKSISLVLQLTNRGHLPLSPLEPGGWLEFRGILNQNGSPEQGALVRIQRLAAGIPPGGSVYLRVDIETKARGTLDLTLTVEGRAMASPCMVYLPLGL